MKLPPHFRPLRRRRPGFTLVELLVVVAIIGVLVALLLPAIQAARESSRRAQCSDNLRQVGLALENHVSAKKKYPPGKKWSGPRSDPNTFAIAWSAYTLDYLEQQALSQKLDLTVPFTDPKNLPASGQVVSIYICPSTSRREEHRGEDHRLIAMNVPGEGMACTDYLGSSGPDRNAENPANGEDYGRQRGVLIGTKGLPNEDTIIEPPAVGPEHIIDGLSNTLVVTECTGRGVEVVDGAIESLNGAWASGSNVSHIERSPNERPAPEAWYKEAIFSDHPGGAQILMCDGSVHFLSDETPERVVVSLCSRDGDEPNVELSL